MSKNEETIEDFIKRNSGGFPDADMLRFLEDRSLEYERDKVRCSLLARGDQEISSGLAHFLPEQIGMVTFYPDQPASPDSFVAVPSVLRRRSGERHPIQRLQSCSTDPTGCYHLSVDP